MGQHTDNTRAGIKAIYALVSFLILTIIATYPLVLHMGNRLVEPGDSLLNTWVINWDIKACLSHPLSLFNANIFYPYKYTLAYTEHMLGDAILAMPVYLAAHNPILTYNFALLSTFVIGGWGMFLLVYYLTRNAFAGVIAGIIFVYNPYRFHELSHLHILSIQWLPFVLLYLHRYFRSHSSKNLFLFCVFFILQGSSSGHICLYQSFIIAVFLFFILASKNNIHRKEWVKLIIGITAACLLLLPLYLPYIYLAKELRFIRHISEVKIYSLSLENFRSVISPGILAFALAVLGIFHPRSKKNETYRWIMALINICIIITLAIIIYVAVHGGFDLGYSILGIKFKVMNLKNPFFFLLGMLIVRTFMQRKPFQPAVFYLFIAIASFLFCFGPKIKLNGGIFTGPYLLLYNYFPGFHGLRVPSRWAVIFMTATAVLAGFGWKNIERWKWTKWVLFPLVLVFLFYGYIHLPLKLRFKIGKEPSVYQWLSRQPNNDAVIELPMPNSYSTVYRETVYMYWSLFYNKRIVNGYSGYSPPAYWPISYLMRSFPSKDSVYLLSYLNVRYIVVHYLIPAQHIQRFNNVLTLRFRNGNDCIYELRGGHKYPQAEKRHLSKLAKAYWRCTSNYNANEVKNAYDNDITTRWDTGEPQKKGMRFQVDLGKAADICRISLYMGRSPEDFPRDIKVEVSKNGILWNSVKSEYCYSKYIINLIQNTLSPRMNINFIPAIDVRYVRMSIGKGSSVNYWSIYEIEVDEQR